MMWERYLLVSFALFVSPWITTRGNGAALSGSNTEGIISNECYFCSSNEKDVDNLEVCSPTHQLNVEKCPVEDKFDRCLVLQAFSTRLNATIIRRQCSSARVCTKELLCKDPDYEDCDFLCCFGDRCNDFNFPAKLVGSRTENGVKKQQVTPEKTLEKSTGKEDSSTFSKECLYCLSDEEGVDNIAACSSNKDLEIEHCSSEDMFDRCLVFQAFSTKLNTTVVRKECSSEILCTEEMLCQHPDYEQCNFQCCFGDGCNNFDIALKETSSKTEEKQNAERKSPSEEKYNKEADETESEILSTKCYTCIGIERGLDNIEQCSIKNDLVVKDCPTEDLFDRCLVFQAFSTKMNITIFRRECVSDRFCSGNMLCADQDFVDCKYECCAGDMCNDFELKKDQRGLSGSVRPREDIESMPYLSGVQSDSPGDAMQCYYCEGAMKGMRDVDSCSSKNDLITELCPKDQNEPYNCIVFQAFNTDQNVTTVRRECIPQNLCTNEMVCSSPDYKNCQFKCCTGSRCNDFDLQMSGATTLPGLTTELPSTKDTIFSGTRTELTPTKTAILDGPATELPTTKDTIFSGPRTELTPTKTASLDGPATELPSTTGAILGAPTITETPTTKEPGLGSHTTPEPESLTSSDTDCEDTRANCSIYASFPGYCDYHRDYMLLYCPKSCDLCSQDNGNFQGGVAVPTTIAKSTETTDSPSSDRTTETLTVGVERFGEELSKELPDGSILEWKISPWGKCESGHQKRTVRCFHRMQTSTNGGGWISYQISVHNCRKNIGKMATKKQQCLI